MTLFVFCLQLDAAFGIPPIFQVLLFLPSSANTIPSCPSLTGTIQAPSLPCGYDLLRNPLSSPHRLAIAVYSSWSLTTSINLIIFFEPTRVSIHRLRPFTLTSLHFTLGFIYAGTLVVSHRTYDLDTAFHITGSASYINLQSCIVR
jgi:hypothetical protein